MIVENLTVRKGKIMVIKNTVTALICLLLLTFTVSCKDEAGEPEAEGVSAASAKKSLTTFNTTLPELLRIGPTSHTSFSVSDGVGPSEPITVFVSNSSESSSGQFSAPIFSGPGASAFKVGSNNCTTSIDPGGFCFFEVVFAPTANGSFSSVLTVTAENMTSNISSLAGVATGFGTSPLLTGTCPPSIDQDAAYSCQLEANDPDAGEAYTWSLASEHTC